MGFDDKGSLTTVTNWEIGRPREKILSPFRHFGTGAGTQMQCGRNGVTDPARSCLEVPRTSFLVDAFPTRRKRALSWSISELMFGSQGVQSWDRTEFCSSISFLPVFCCMTIRSPAPTHHGLLASRRVRMYINPSALSW
ncbi:hypothetical protein HL42_8159 [Trichophyton rubrum]|nr:hypothetical protein HL42_8159 [Trichophyton rubrum]